MGNLRENSAPQFRLTRILRLDVSIIASCISGGLKHSTHWDHRIVFLNRSVKNLHLAAFRSVIISIPQRLRDAGFERIRFFTLLEHKSWELLLSVLYESDTKKEPYLLSPHLVQAHLPLGVDVVLVDLQGLLKGFNSFPGPFLLQNPPVDYPECVRVGKEIQPFADG